jgi:3-dehydroquinate dehydratase-2
MAALHRFAAPWRVRSGNDDEYRVVSIVIVHGPHGSGHSPTADLLCHLKQQAFQAGRTLELKACGALRDFIALVRSVRSETTEFVLLDPGNLAPEIRAHPEAGLSEAIDELRAPYIDVHDEFGDGFECCAGLHKPPIATVIINGNIGSSYRIGLRLALRRLEIGGYEDARRTTTPANAKPR